MKKSIALILTIVLAVSALAGCAGTTVVVGECTCPVEHIEQMPVELESIPAATDDTLISAGAAKTGLAVIPSVSKSVSATAEAAGAAEYDVTVVAVTVNDEGVIQSCAIDSIPATVNFDTTGTITTDLTAPVQTKNEKGENYGMVAWGGAIAEWNEQAASFAAYITGMTADEVAGIAVSESTKPADGSDLASSVTIAIGGFQALIAKAMQ